MFFQKYVKFDLPDESTLRRTYLEPIYQQTINSIRNNLQNQYIWLRLGFEEENLKQYSIIFCNIVLK